MSWRLPAPGWWLWALSAAGIIWSRVWAQRGRAGGSPGSRVGCEGGFGRARLPAVSSVAALLLAVDLGTENPQYCRDPAEPLPRRLRDAGTAGTLPARRAASPGPCIPPTPTCAPSSLVEGVPPPSVAPRGPQGLAPGAPRVFPARFPPSASVTGAGAEMGGAWGRHKCATAASSLPWLHPARLLTVALATSYRWGIYRGWEAGGGREWVGVC